MGRIDHAAVKRLVLCVLLPVYRSGVKLPTESVFSMCQQARIKIRKDRPLPASFVIDMCKVQVDLGIITLEG